MTRILITALVGAVLSGLLGYLLIPMLRAMKVGQSIREVGPIWHNYKAGTPMIWRFLENNRRQNPGIR